MPKGCSLNYAQMLCLGRCNVLLFDLRGEGGSAGHSRSFGVREARDVLGAVQYLEQEHAEASHSIYALGISQGASAVLRAAATDVRVRAVVVDSTLTISQDLLPVRVLQRVAAGPADILEDDDLCVRVGRAWVQSFSPNRSRDRHA